MRGRFAAKAAAFVAAAFLGGVAPQARNAQAAGAQAASTQSADGKPSHSPTRTTAAAGPGGSDPALADKGKRLYTGYCARCHGLNMVSVGAAFFDLRTFPADDKPRFVNSVLNGKRVMPAWKDTLKPDEIEALWAYVMTAKR